MAEETKEPDEPKPLVTEEEVEEIIKKVEREELLKKVEEKEPETFKVTPTAPVEPPPETPAKPPTLQTPPALPPVTRPPLPQPQAPKPKNPLVTFLRYFFLVIFLIVLAYLSINYKSYLLKAKYIYDIVTKGKPSFSLDFSALSQTGEINLSDSLIIPKIGVSGPIIWQVKEEEILTNLKKGLVHFKGTALPNEEGTIVLTGLSFSYPWQNEKYGQTLTLLGNLEEGDTVAIIYQKKKYLFGVTKKEIKKADEIQISNDSGADLILMTDWPIGIRLRKLVVEAKQTEKPSLIEEKIFLPSEPEL